MKSFAIIAIAVMGVAVPVVSRAEYPPSHSCTKPYKPYQFADDYAVLRFKNEVEDYKQCLQDFMDEQERAAKMHRNAANDAVDEWNNYVKYDLR